MTKSYDLPVKEIAKLRELEGMTFKKITEELDLPCHPDTTRRHYKKYQQKRKEIAEDIKMKKIEKNHNSSYITTTNTTNIPQEELSEKKTFWQKIKDFFTGGNN